VAETEKRSAWLLDHASDTYSQTGEDGIIEKILEHIPQKDRWCVEFGAWDGRLFSNTCNLIESKDYSSGCTCIMYAIVGDS